MTVAKYAPLGLYGLGALCAILFCIVAVSIYREQRAGNYTFEADESKTPLLGKPQEFINYSYGRY